MVVLRGLATIDAYKYMNACTYVPYVHGTHTHTHKHTHKHIGVCTMYIQIFEFMNVYVHATYIYDYSESCTCTYMYIHVHKFMNMYIHVCTMFGHVCPFLLYLVQVGRIPDVLVEIQNVIVVKQHSWNLLIMHTLFDCQSFVLFIYIFRLEQAG